MGAPVVRTAAQQKIIDDLCKGRCHTCAEGFLYTERSIKESTYQWHAVGAAQLICHAKDLRVLADTLLREIAALKQQLRDDQRDGRAASRDAAAEKAWDDRADQDGVPRGSY